MRFYNTPAWIIVALKLQITLTGRTIAPPILGRAGSSVLAGTHLRAILAEGVLWTQLAAILAAVSGRADASAVDGRTLRVILAVAVILAVLAIHVKGTRSGASLAVPSHLTGALPGPRMAQFCIVVLAFANLSIWLNLKYRNIVKVLNGIFYKKQKLSPLRNCARRNHRRKHVDRTFHLSSPNRICRCRY